MKRFKKISLIAVVAMLSVIAMTWPLIAWADNSEEHGMGYLQPEAEINYVESSRKLLRSGNTHVSKYDPREEDWYKNNIVVKNQRSTGLCWAFSTTTAAEISYLKESGKYLAELSPGHLGFFAYNRSSSLSDPLGNTLGDSTCTNSTSAWYNVGGNAEYVLQTLANWIGLAGETTASSAWVGKPTSFTGYDDSLAYKDSLIVENVEYLENYNGNSIDTIKSLIEEYGAVTCAICDPNSSMYCIKANNDYALYSLYANQAHAVTIIGWDDNYSKDNFANTPEGDGAWLIQNSWGTESYNKPYIWVSYYDGNVNDNIAAFDMTEKDDDMFCFQYDGGINPNYSVLEDGDQIANIYKVPDDASYSLYSVGFTEWNEGHLTYKISVYQNLTNSKNPSSGKLVTSKTVSTEHSGYHTFELDDEVIIQAGSYYSIVIEFDGETSIGIDQTSNAGSTIRSVVTTSSNQSLYKLVGATVWSDANDMPRPATFRIKGNARKINKGILATVTGYSGDNLKVVIKDSKDNTFTARKTPYLFCEMSKGSYTAEVSADGDYVAREYSGMLTGDYEHLTLEIRELGDANCDGARTAEDVTRIARHIARLDVEQDEYSLKLFDTNRTGTKPDAADVTHLARFIAGIISEL